MRAVPPEGEKARNKLTKKRSEAVEQEREVCGRPRSHALAILAGLVSRSMSQSLRSESL